MWKVFHLVPSLLFAVHMPSTQVLNPIPGCMLFKNANKKGNSKFSALKNIAAPSIFLLLTYSTIVHLLYKSTVALHFPLRNVTNSVCMYYFRNALC